MVSTGTSAAPPPELGRYRLIARLARGGMGDVYLAMARGPGRFHKLLVVKELRPEFADDKTYVAMFLEEARLAARLSHPNIVQTNEVGSDGPRPYMTMEYLDGRSLLRVVKKLSDKGGLPLGAHLRVIAEALLGLHYAHELRGFDGEPLGIVHRDVSPLNVLVTFDGQAKVLDFGIAKAFDSTLDTQPGMLKGRIAYMAPEQARGERVDRRADVYAAGVMIWEALAGRRLWAGMSDVQILRKTLGDGPPRLRSVHPSTPADLDALCARAMARSPEDRHPTAADLLSDLDSHLARRDDGVSMRQLSAIVCSAFDSERRRMSALIEEALAGVWRVPPSGAMPTPSAWSVGGTGGGFRRPGDPADDVVSISSLVSMTPPSPSAPSARSVRAFSAVRSSRPTIPDGVRRPQVSVKLAAVGCGIVAVAALVVALVHRSDPQLPSAPPPGPAPAVQLMEQGDREIGRGVAAPQTSRSPDLPAPSTAGATPAPVRPPPRAPKYVSPESARPSSATSDPPAGAAAAGPRPEVDPAGGRAPLRPIATSNPYGVP